MCKFKCGCNIDQNPETCTKYDPADVQILLDEIEECKAELDKFKKIDEEKLHKYTEEYYTNHKDLPPYANTDTVWKEIKAAFEDGYHKAKEE